MKKLFYLIFVGALIVSCGESGSSEKQLDVITNTEKIYTFDDLISTEQHVWVWRVWKKLF